MQELTAATPFQLRLSSVEMAGTMPLPHGDHERDPIANEWVRGEISDQDYVEHPMSLSGKEREDDLRFADRRELAVTITRQASDNGGSLTSDETSIVMAVIHGMADMDYFREKLGLWCANYAGPNKARA